MKICLINSLYEPLSRGGAEKVAEMIAQGLVARGHHVIVITLGRAHEIERRHNFTLYRIKPLNLRSFIDLATLPVWLRPLWHMIDVFNIWGRRAVKKILLAEKPDCLMTHNLKGIGYLIPRLARQLKIRHLHYLHDVQLSRPSGLIIFGQEKPFLMMDKGYEKICRYLFSSPDIVISPSQWLLQYYRARGFFYASKKIILPHPIKAAKRPGSKTPGPKLVFVFVGQLEDSKGIDFLIRALMQLSEKNWNLKIAGIGGSEARLRKMTQGDGRFQWYGYVRHGQLSQLYQQADAVILPSLCYENSPTVVPESFAHGVPVIASDIGGISEMVQDRVNGYLFEPGNAQNVRELVRYVLQHPQELQKLRDRIIQTAPQSSLEKYFHELDKLISL